MSSYVVSNEADVEQIARATLKIWGLLQAERYIADLHEAFERLAEFPRIGRDASRIRIGYRRMEIESHMVFYFCRDSDILIVRVLHQRMLSEDYL